EILKGAGSMQRPSTEWGPISSCLLTLVVTLLASVSAISQTTTHVVVPANPIWTDTGISLTKGEAVTMSATGQWNYAFGNVGPDGDPNFFVGDGDEFEFYDIVDHGRLLAFVGSDPFQGEWGNSAFFPRTKGYVSVGSGQTFQSPASGHLWLGINDDA